MEQFIENELQDLAFAKRITKLFILGPGRLGALKESMTFQTMKERCTIVFFTEFILVFFLEQYLVPKTRCIQNKQNEYSFKALKKNIKINRHDFVFKYLIQDFKFELDQILNDGQIENILKTKSLPKMKLLQKVLPKTELLKKQLSKFHQTQIQEIGQNQEDREENQEIQDENQIQQDQREFDGVNLKRKFNELEDIDLDLKISIQIQQKQISEQSQQIQEQYGQLESQKFQINEQSQQIQIQNQTIQNQQQQIAGQSQKIDQMKSYFTNEIQILKKRSIEKNEIHKQEIEHKEYEKKQEMKKKQMEKNQLIRKGEEELKNQNKELNFKNDVLQFFIVGLLNNINQIKERFYNFNNQNVQQISQQNLSKIEQFVQQQYRKSTPSKKTPIKTPVK